ncbi:MAG: response regulator [Chitinivibrionales bacterium]|nr:response regulator [Chitinivibrionales bacterium]
MPGCHACSGVCHWRRVCPAALCIAFGAKANFSMDEKLVREIKRELEEYRSLLKVIPDIIYKIDPDGNFVYVNEAVESLGYSACELLGCHFSVLVHPDDIDSVSRDRALPKLKGRLTGPLNAPRLFDERRTGARATKNQVVRIIPKSFGQNDENWRYGEIDSSGLYNADVRSTEKQFLGSAGVIHDISARHRLEQEKRDLEEQLVESKRLEAVGRLAGGVAHDFNNILGAIAGYADLIKMRIGEENSSLQKYVNMIIDGSRRAADLTEKLLAFGRKGSFEKAPVSIVRLIDDVAGLLERTVDNQIRIVKEYNVGEASVMGDPDKLRTALLNLALNARDAMPEGGELTFAADAVSLDQAYIAAHGTDIKPGEYGMVSVGDTGTGIQRELQTKVFEPFFTTKKRGRGVGLGLASVYGTARSHGGSVEIYSEQGEGTTAKLYLPLIDTPQETLQEINEGHQKQGATIMLIDDQKAVREASADILYKLGYAVVACSNGPEAIDYYTNHSKDIDLIILDIFMPGMGGYECFRKLKEINPDLKVIISSGYTINDDSRKILNEGACGFLQKPYDVRRLSLMINRAFC